MLVVLAGWWVYQPALSGGWVWDDHIDLVQNPLMSDPAGWWKIWVAPTGWHFFPLKSTVQWLQWQLWGPHPTGYHVTNLILHLAGALLLWRVLTRLGVRHGWVGALLFTVHPLAVESVAWITELKNTLSLPPLLLATLAWLDFDERGRRGDALRALAWFTVAMLAKSSVVMFPVGLVLFALWKHGRISRATGLAALPFFGVSLVLGLVTVVFEGRHDHVIASLLPDLSWPSRLAGAGLALAFYLWKGLLPVGLSPVYAEWPLANLSPAWLAGWLVPGTLAAAVWLRRATWGRAGVLALGWFVLNLLPVVGLVPIAYHHIAWVADHFAYLSLAAIAGLAAAGTDLLDRRLGPRTGLIVPLALAGVLVVPARQYAAAFRDEESLWSRAVETQPDAWLGHHNLAYVYGNTRRFDEAITHYRIALRLKPADVDAANNLGNALLARGEPAAAITAYEQAIRILPSHAEAHANLGNALAKIGRRPEAVAACQRALMLDPRCQPAELTLGDLFAQDGRFVEAESHYAAALRLRPDDALALNNRGTALLQLGRASEARDCYERALQLTPDYVEARVNLGYALVDLHDSDGAMATWTEALVRAPGNVAALGGLGDLLFRAGRLTEAEVRYRAALDQRPDDAELHQCLAVTLARLNRPQEAIRECESALRLRPDYAEARATLERLQR